MKFVPAKLDDAALLLDWRNDPGTRSMSLSPGEIDWQTHVDWLSGKISSCASDIYVVHHNGRPIGSIRCEHCEDHHAISWVIAPDHRSRGLGKQMLREFVKLHENRYIATIRVENVASQKMCRFAGFSEFSHKDGLVHFRNY